MTGKIVMSRLFVKTGTVQPSGFSQAKRSRGTLRPAKFRCARISLGRSAREAMTSLQSDAASPQRGLGERPRANVWRSLAHPKCAVFNVPATCAKAAVCSGQAECGDETRHETPLVMTRTWHACRRARQQVEPNCPSGAKLREMKFARFGLSTSYRTKRICRIYRQRPYSCCSRQIEDDGHERQFAWNPSVWISRSNRTMPLDASVAADNGSQGQRVAVSRKASGARNLAVIQLSK